MPRLARRRLSFEDPASKWSWFEESLDATPVGDQSTFFLARPSSSQKSTLTSSPQVFIEKLGHGRSAALSQFLRGRINTFDDFRKKALRFVPSCFGRPRGSVTTDGEPALASFPSAILQRVEHGHALPSAGTKPGDARVPKCPALTEVANVSDADSDFYGSHDRVALGCAGYHMATNSPQRNGGFRKPIQ
jgi:hypothetical protein